MTPIIDHTAMIADARARMQRSVAMRRCRERMPDADDEINDCIDTVASCVGQLLQVQRACNAVDFQIKGQNLELSGNCRMPLDILQYDVTDATQCYVYGCTLGFDSSDALQALGQDYILHQFQHYLSRELLFITGRDIFTSITREYPDLLLKRCAVLLKSSRADERPCLDEDDDARPTYWSPQDVSQLLQFLPELGNVRVLESGCLSPIYTLLGIMFTWPRVSQGDQHV